MKGELKPFRPKISTNPQTLHRQGSVGSVGGKLRRCEHFRHALAQLFQRAPFLRSFAARTPGGRAAENSRGFRVGTSTRKTQLTVCASLPANSSHFRSLSAHHPGGIARGEFRTSISSLSEVSPGHLLGTRIWSAVTCYRKHLQIAARVRSNLD